VGAGKSDACGANRRPCRIGEGEIRVSGLIAGRDYDRLAAGVSDLGCHALVDPAGLASLGGAAGQHCTSGYRVRLPAGADPKSGDGFPAKRLEEAAGASANGTTARPELARFVDSLGNS
jgi:hypothetical protein